MRFGAHRKTNESNDNKLKVRKETYQEKVEELDLSRDKGREVKSVIKEVPEGAEVQESDDSITDEIDPSVSKSDNSNNRVTSRNDNEEENKKTPKGKNSSNLKETNYQSNKLATERTANISNQKDSDMNLINLEMESSKVVYNEQKDPSSTKININKYNQPLNLDKQRSNSNQDKNKLNKKQAVDRK